MYLDKKEQVATCKKCSGIQGFWLVMAMSCYQWGLCFLNTNVMKVSFILVAVTEAALVGIAALFLLKSVSLQKVMALLLLLFGYFSYMWIIRMGVDFQVFRNILIIIVFYFLGKLSQDINRLDQAIWRLSCFVFLIALAEYCITEPYLKIFNIQQYFIDRGLLKNNIDYFDLNVLFNGVRFSGRNFFAFLGNQRISSVFLEPVSMGNFAAIIAMWGLSFPQEERHKAWKHFAMAIFFVIASDSRFASLMIIVLFFVGSIKAFHHKIVLSILPLCVIVFLLGLSALFPDYASQDNFPGRLIRSGVTLWNTNILQWMGIGDLRGLGDMGIAYSVENYSLPLIIILWVAYVFIPFKTEQGRKFHAMAAYYTISILMISGTSFYSAKTAALLWFVVGALSLHQINFLPKKVSGGVFYNNE